MVLQYMQNENSLGHLSGQNIAVSPYHGMLHARGEQPSYVDQTGLQPLAVDSE
jgi:hypothetical protein